MKPFPLLICSVFLLAPQNPASAFTTAQDANRDWRVDFVKQLVDARSTREPLPQLTARYPKATLEDGYWLQKRFVAELLKSDRLGGFKGAAAGAAAQKGLGVDGPLSAVLLASGRIHFDSKPTISLRKFPGTAIETEIGFTFRHSITRKVAGVEELTELVRGVVAVIELPAGNREVKTKPAAADIVAVNVGSANYIVGPERPAALVHPDSVSIVLRSATEVLHETSGKAAKDGQWQNLLHQVNHAIEQGYEIGDQHLVITGALGGIHPAKPGDYSADFGSLGRIQFQITK